MVLKQNLAAVESGTMSLSGRGGRCDRASGRVAKSNMDAKSGARSIATISAATALSSDHDMSPTIVLAVVGCIFTGGAVMCVYTEDTKL